MYCNNVANKRKTLQETLNFIYIYVSTWEHTITDTPTINER
jgi:hypothetical protein